MLLNDYLYHWRQPMFMSILGQVLGFVGTLWSRK